VASKSTQLPQVAANVPAGNKPESRVKRFARWVHNDTVTEQPYVFPSADVLLTHVALQTLVLVMDGSVVGRGCVALMVHVVYKGRALPLAWLVRQGKKGHFPEALHITLLEQVQRRIPAGAQVVLLGDGEFDGPTLQQTVQEYHWSYVVRTGSNITVMWDGETFRCETVASCIKPGTLVELADVRVTQEAYGPVMLICCWAKG
jgi:Transposase DDE domain